MLLSDYADKSHQKERCMEMIANRSENLQQAEAVSHANNRLGLRQSCIRTQRSRCKSY